MEFDGWGEETRLAGLNSSRWFRTTGEALFPPYPRQESETRIQKPNHQSGEHTNRNPKLVRKESGSLLLREAQRA